MRHANALKHENFRLVETRDEPPAAMTEQPTPPTHNGTATSVATVVASGEAGAQGEPVLKARIDNLKAAALTLLQEVHALTEVETANMEQGIDFYEEVRRFEMQLITRALEQTGGHQGRA
ncbi:MAG TPA: hypothetical protein VF754_10005, partial [Pyrinomonadaceae bacterium]